MTPSLTQALARYAASTSMERIPGDVKERAKQVIFDEMACAQFGRRSIAGDLAARYAKSIGGAQESLILGMEKRSLGRMSSVTIPERHLCTWSDLSRKWHDGLPECDVDRMIALALGLEGIEDVHVLSAAFT